MVAPLVEVCNYLLTDAFASHIPEKIQPYLRDVCDHALRDQREAVSVPAGNIGDDLADQPVAERHPPERSHQETSGLGALLAIPTMVFSIYGMNFKGWFPELEWRYGYPVVMGGVAVTCLLLHRYLKKSGWL